MASLARTTAVPEAETAPLNLQARAPADGEPSPLVLHSLLETSFAQDPDLAAAIAERRSQSVSDKHGKIFCAKPKAASVGLPEAPTTFSGVGPEEHDSSYFALLTKISELEAAKQRLETQVACTKEDATTYEEVALELENDLNIVVAENALNIAAIAKHKLESAETAARLVCAEQTIAKLLTQLQASPLAETDARDVEKDFIRLHAIAMAAQSSQAGPASAPTSIPNRTIDASDSCLENAIVSTCDASIDLTFSVLRMHKQRAAVEYRRAVREHLQSVAREGRQGVPRSYLTDLYSTPCDMLDYEVLSEDEGESDLCIRRWSWSGGFRTCSPSSVC